MLEAGINQRRSQHDSQGGKGIAITAPVTGFCMGGHHTSSFGTALYHLAELFWKLNLLQLALINKRWLQRLQSPSLSLHPHLASCGVCCHTFWQIHNISTLLIWYRLHVANVPNSICLASCNHASDSTLVLVRNRGMCTVYMYVHVPIMKLASP